MGDKPEGEWVTIAKKEKTNQASSSTSQPKPRFVYVVFSGRQPGFYYSWAQCHSQINGYPGACHQKFNTIQEAIKAWENWMRQFAPTNLGTPSNIIYEFSKLQTKENLLNTEVCDFYNPGIPYELYEPLNEVWRSHLQDKRKDFRKHLSRLADKISEQTEVLDKFKNLSLKILKILNFGNEDFSLEKIDNFLAFADLLENDFSDKIFNTIRRICLFEKAKQILPRPLFQIEILPKVEDQDEKIKSLLIQNINYINFSDEMPKIHFFAEDSFGPSFWTIEPIEWGLVNKLIFPSIFIENLEKLPMMIKAMINHVLSKGRSKYIRYLSFHISSTIGWRAREIFYQPYQIWDLRITENWEWDEIDENPYDRPLEHLDTERYWSQNLIDISRTATYLIRESELKFMVTDGRRLFVTNLPINYTTTLEQRAEVKRFLENLKDKNNLDIPYEMLSNAEEYELAQLNPHFQSPNQDYDFDSVAEANIENAMEG